MKHSVLIIALLSLSLLHLRMEAQELCPLEGVFESKENKLTLHLNAYKETVEVPGMSYLGKLHGYLDGAGVYGTWFILSCRVEDNVAELRLSNDMGSDAQTVVFKATNDSVYNYKAVGGNAIRKAVGRKLVKIDDTMTFKRTSPKTLKRKSEANKPK